MGLFDALLLTPSMPNADAEGIELLRTLVNVHEFILAFSQLTAIVVREGRPISEDAWAILNHIAERVRAEPRDWNGLCPPNPR